MANVDYPLTWSSCFEANFTVALIAFRYSTNGILTVAVEGVSSVVLNVFLASYLSSENSWAEHCSLSGSSLGSGWRWCGC